MVLIIRKIQKARCQALCKPISGPELGESLSYEALYLHEQSRYSTLLYHNVTLEKSFRSSSGFYLCLHFSPGEGVETDEAYPYTRSKPHQM